MSHESISTAERKVTASDVAKRAGVSKWTVSRAFTPGASISPRTLERVQKAADELGYRPNLLARSLSKKHTNLVGLVVDELENPNILKVLAQVTAQLQRKGIISMVLNITSDHDYGAALSLADQFQVDGVIFLGTVLPDELIDLVKNVRHIPLIVLYRNSDIPDIQVVATDGNAAGRSIGQLFVDQSYHRIGYLAGPSSQSTQLQRFEGFEGRLSESGLHVELVLGGGGYSRIQGYQAVKGYLERTAEQERIEALFCENDVLAIGALDALRESGNEGSIAIVGFDDIEQAASPSYQLTTVRQPLELLVDEAIGRLSHNPQRPRRTMLEGELVLRRSHLLGH